MAEDKALKLDLLENAIDSIIHGLEHYVKGKRNATNYKFAILHIAQGVELILKERLRQEHWVLIYDKVEKPNKSRTIDFETAVARLQSICNISLAKHIDGLRRLRNARHEIEHYKVSLSEQEATALIGSNVPFLMEFLDNELGTTLQEHIRDKKTWLELLEIAEVFKKAIVKAREEIALLCSRREEGEEYPRIVECPLCGLEFLVIKDENDKKSKCLLCRHVSKLKECIRCHKLFSMGEWLEEGGLCADCAPYREESHIDQYLKILNTATE
jgi:hypothetical protein